MRRLAITTLVLSFILAAVPATAAEPGTGSPNMRHITHLSYQKRYGQQDSRGTDIEFARIKGREYAFAGSYQNGLQIIDITNPSRPRPVAVYDCAVSQGDVQIFRRGSRTLVGYAADDYGDNSPDSDCYREAKVFDQRNGTFFVDVSDPRRPKTVGFVDIPKGSHNETIHPSGNYLYNSNADFTPGNIEIFNITNLAKPKKVGELPLVTGIESHDITFSADGKRAYAAALTHTLILDTTNPAKPTIIGRILDPAINIHHQSDPITINDPALGKRTFLVVTDELAGAAGNGFCPGGGLHVYDITGELERAPVKVGFWAMPDVRLASDNIVCTSHVLRFYPQHNLMTIAWYEAGVRVVDVSNLVGVSLGAVPTVGNVGAGMREIGYYTLPDADTWSAKTNRIERDGSFYLFGNDFHRGLDVYRFDGKAPVSRRAGVWRTPKQALADAKARGIVPVSSKNSPFCLLLKRR